MVDFIGVLRKDFNYPYIKLYYIYQKLFLFNEH